MEKLFKLLSDIQANLFVLFHKTWVFHWNVIGPDFQQLHTLFGEQYEAMFGEIDRLSEHMRYLNVRPVGTLSRILEVTTIGEGSGVVQVDEMGQRQVIPGKPIYKSDEMIKRLMTDNMILLELLTEASEEAGTQRSYATENLLQDLMESHGKFIWMLRSCVEKNTKDSVDDSEVPIQMPVDPVDQQMQMAQVPQVPQPVQPPIQ
jgi:starvation-inducible DNA-binding protein